MQELAKACHSGTSVEHPALALKAQTNLCKTLLPTLLGLLRLVRAEYTAERQNRWICFWFWTRKKKNKSSRSCYRFRAFGRQPPGHLAGLTDQAEESETPLFLRLFPPPSFPPQRKATPEGDFDKEKKVSENGRSGAERLWTPFRHRRTYDLVHMNVVNNSRFSPFVLSCRSLCLKTFCRKYPLHRMGRVSFRGEKMNHLIVDY